MDKNYQKKTNNSTKNRKVEYVIKPEANNDRRDQVEIVNPEVEQIANNKEGKQIVTNPEVNQKVKSILTPKIVSVEYVEKKQEGQHVFEGESNQTNQEKITEKKIEENLVPNQIKPIQDRENHKIFNQNNNISQKNGQSDTYVKSDIQNDSDDDYSFLDDEKKVRMYYEMYLAEQEQRGQQLLNEVNKKFRFFCFTPQNHIDEQIQRYMKRDYGDNKQLLPPPPPEQKPCKKIADKKAKCKAQQRKEEEKTLKQEAYFQKRIDDFSHFKIITNRLQQSQKQNSTSLNYIWKSSDLPLSDSIDQIEKDILEPIKIILSRKEKSIALSQSNQLIIGRSGTGKTTTAIVKLTAMQKSFQREYIKRNPKELEHFVMKKKLMKQGSEFVNGDILRVCFTTISNFLTLDVYNFFRKVMGGFEVNKQEVSRLSDVSSWPHFTNIRELILQIDGNLAIPFVRRDEEGNIIILNEMDVNLDNRLFIKSKNESDQQFEEINIKIFKQNFWNPNRNKFESMQIDPYIAYSQINSYITGHQSSYQSDLNMISVENYLSQVGKNKTYLTNQQKQGIYSICKQYQEWKKSKNYFDFNDIVNYIIKCIFKGMYNSEDGYFHYLFVDEVQDLNCATLYLLSLLTEQNIYLGGDTAQTINNENAFRFADLKAIFNMKKMNKNKAEEEDEYEEDEEKKHDEKEVEEEIIKTNFVLESEIQQTQLTQNFRSHGSIIELNNTIVRLLEVFFPTSIDHLIPEVSLKAGPKPIVVTSRKYLYKFIEQDDKEKGESVNYFGRLQVYIVRDEKEKKQLKETLDSDNKKGSIFTVLESKGLEFQDVITYNLLSRTVSFTKCWNALTLLNVKDEQMNIGEFQTHFNCELKDEFEGSTFKREKDSDFVTLKQLEKKPNADAKIQKDYSHEFNVLISELKNIYVSFSRARSRIFIYEEGYSNSKNSKQNVIINLLNELMLLDQRTITDESIESILNEHMKYIEENEAIKNNKEQMMSLAQQLEERKNYELAAYYYGLIRENESEKICLSKFLIQKTDKYLSSHKDQFEKERKQAIEGQGLLKALSVYTHVKTNYLECIELLKETKEVALIARLYHKLGLYKETIKYNKKQIDVIKAQPDYNDKSKKIASITSQIKQLYFMQAQILEMNKLQQETEDNYRELEQFLLDNNSDVDGQVLLYLSFRLNDIDKLFTNLINFKSKNLIEEEDLINTLHYYYPKILEEKLKQILELELQDDNDSRKQTQTTLGEILKDLITKLIIPFEKEFIRIAKSRQNMEYFQSQLAIFDELSCMSTLKEVKEVDKNENIISGKNMMMFYIMLIHFNCQEAIKKFNNILQSQKLSHLIYIEDLYKNRQSYYQMAATFNEISKNPWIKSGKGVTKQIYFQSSLFYVHLGLWDLLLTKNLIVENKETDDIYNFKYFDYTLQLFHYQNKSQNLDFRIKNDFDKLKFFYNLVFQQHLGVNLDIKRLQFVQNTFMKMHTLEFLTDKGKLELGQFNLISQKIIQFIKYQDIKAPNNMERLLMCQDLLYSFYQCLIQIQVNEFMEELPVTNLMTVIDFIIHFNSDENEKALLGDSNQIFIDALCSCFGFVSTSFPMDFQEERRYFWKLVGYNQYYLVNNDNPILQNQIFKSERHISPFISMNYNKMKLIDKKSAILYTKKRFGEAAQIFITKYSIFLKNKIGHKQSYQNFKDEDKNENQYYLQSLYLNDSLKQLFTKILRQENILMQKIPQIHAREHELETLNELIKSSDDIKKQFFMEQLTQKKQNQKTNLGLKLIQDTECMNMIDQSAYIALKNEVILNSLVIQQYDQKDKFKKYLRMREFFENEAVKILSNILMISECQQEVQNTKRQLLKENEEDFEEEEHDVVKDDMLKYSDDILYAQTLLNMSSLQQVLIDVQPSLNNELGVFTKLSIEFFDARKNQNRILFSTKSIEILYLCRQNLNCQSQQYILQIGLAELLLLLTDAHQQKERNQMKKGENSISSILLLQQFERFFQVEIDKNEKQIIRMQQFEEFTNEKEVISQLIKYFEMLFELLPTLYLQNMNGSIMNMIIQNLLLSLITYPELLSSEKLRKQISQIFGDIFKNSNQKVYPEFKNSQDFYHYLNQISINSSKNVQGTLHSVGIFRGGFWKTFQTLLKDYGNTNNQLFTIQILLENLSKECIQLTLLQTTNLSYQTINVEIIRLNKNQNEIKDQTMDEKENELKEQVKTKQKEKELKEQVMKQKEILKAKHEEKEMMRNKEEKGDEPLISYQDNKSKQEEEERDKHQQSLYVTLFYKPDFNGILNQHIYRDLKTYKSCNENIANQRKTFEKYFLEFTILTQKVRKIFLEELNQSIEANEDSQPQYNSLKSSENYIYIIQKLNDISSQELLFYQALSSQDSFIYTNPNFEKQLEQLSTEFKDKMKQLYVDYLNYLAEPKEKIKQRELNSIQFIAEQINLKQ